MINPKMFDDLVKKIKESVPPGLKELPGEWEQNVRSLLQAQFNKLDLVTREEFDAQRDVLVRTRKKLEALEAQVTELEQRLEKTTGQDAKHSDR